MNFSPKKHRFDINSTPVQNHNNSSIPLIEKGIRMLKTLQLIQRIGSLELKPLPCQKLNTHSVVCPHFCGSCLAEHKLPFYRPVWLRWLFGASGSLTYARDDIFIYVHKTKGKKSIKIQQRKSLFLVSKLFRGEIGNGSSEQRLNVGEERNVSDGFSGGLAVGDLYQSSNLVCPPWDSILAEYVKASWGCDVHYCNTEMLIRSSTKITLTFMFC